ncbi:MAG TPA: DUF433 domain-containing protein [Thermoanaerobaculia bacterium]|nr:DUF433 domain-containing protein [Thermoanaerobaculia bacterium]
MGLPPNSSHPGGSHSEGGSLLGLGVYSVPEAARLTGVSSQRIRRWLQGYSYTSGDSARTSRPLWQRQIASQDSLILSFRDLLEVRFVDAFRRHGVTWKTIRIAAERAAEIVHDSYPFSTRRFKTDGRSIFAEILQATGDESLLDLVKSQYEFKSIVEPFLFEGLEFSALGIEPVRWWPLGMNRRVVIDPERSFGQPIVDPESVPTRILAHAFEAEKSIQAVARWYEVDPQSVRDAVDFEAQPAKAA